MKKFFRIKSYKELNGYTNGIPQNAIRKLYGTIFIPTYVGRDYVEHPQGWHLSSPMVKEVNPQDYIERVVLKKCTCNIGCKNCDYIGTVESITYEVFNKNDVQYIL